MTDARLILRHWPKCVKWSKQVEEQSQFDIRAMVKKVLRQDFRELFGRERVFFLDGPHWVVAF